jgi:inner membrane protein
MGRAGLNRHTALATLTLTLAAEAPDLDIIGGMVRGPAFGFAHHRGFTHSFVGILIDAVVVVGFVYLIWRLRGRKTKDPNLPSRWGLLFFYACLAGLSHILLDYTNNYGVRPFWPFSEKWYSWDIVFIFEPVMFAFLVLGLIVPSLFGLIDKEIGARRRGPRGRVAATLALVGVVLLWGMPWKRALTMESTRCECRLIRSGSILSTGTEWWKRQHFLRLRRSIRLRRRWIPMGVWRFATNRKRLQ